LSTHRHLAGRGASGKAFSALPETARNGRIELLFIGVPAPVARPCGSGFFPPSRT